jgi:hypothetical protein
MIETRQQRGGLLVTQRLWCALLVVFYVAPHLNSQENGCMSTPAFSQWAKLHHFPYRSSSERAKSIKSGYKRLRLGMSFAEATSIMPKPDWAREGWKGCTWHYATDVDSDGVNAKGVTVRFSAEQFVNGFAKGGILSPVHD